MEGKIASQAALWRVSRYTGVSLRWCRLSRFSGPLSSRETRLKTSPKTLPKTAPRTATLQTETSPKTSLCRNPFLTHNVSQNFEKSGSSLKFLTVAGCTLHDRLLLAPHDAFVVCACLSSCLEIPLLLFLLGRCERVLRFMGREVLRETKIQNETVKWVVAKLQGDKTASFCMQTSGREVAGR